MPSTTRNRESILADIKTTLQGITTANGYDSDVKLVEQERRTYEEVERSRMPWIGFWPALTQPPVVPYPFGQYAKILEVEVWAHVATDQDPTTEAGRTERIQRLGRLEEDILVALDVDPTRGGYAVDTLQVAPASTDEGVPDQVQSRKRGERGSTGSLRIAFRCSFYPYD